MKRCAYIYVCMIQGKIFEKIGSEMFVEDPVYILCKTWQLILRNSTRYIYALSNATNTTTI